MEKSWKLGAFGTMLLLLGGACVPMDLGDLNGTETSPTPAPTPVDQDGDGSPADLDCDDTNEAVNPLAQEVCDGIDNDCDQATDEDLTVIAFPDEDGDEFGVGPGAEQACTIVTGIAFVDGDCDDTNAAIYPGAPELCNEGVDDDCSPTTDENTLLYPDGDEDGFAASDAQGTRRCDALDSYTDLRYDCDDTNADVHPILVDDDGVQSLPDAPYLTSFQDGIDAISGTCPTLLVRSGEYVGPFAVVGVPNLTILAVDGPANTLLKIPDEYEGGDPVLALAQVTGFTLNGFTLRADLSFGDFGGGIRIESSDGVLLTGLDVSDFHLPSRDTFGAGVGITTSQNVTIEDSYFSGNEAYQAAAVGVDTSVVEIHNCTFRHNIAEYFGGAIGVGDVLLGDGPGTLHVSESYFFDNEAGYGGGAGVADTLNTLEIERCLFEKNLTVEDSLVALGSGGGALYNPAFVSESYFIENKANTYSGAIMLSDSGIVQSSVFYRNRGVVSGGAVTLYGPVSKDSPKDSIIQFNTFVDNTSAQGASIYYYDADFLLLASNVFYNNIVNETNFCNAEVIGSVEVTHSDFYSTYSNPNSSGCFDSTEFDFDRDYYNLYTDPLFEKYSSGAPFWDNSFHLKPESPCIGTAKPGPNGETYDMGAYSGPSPLTWIPEI